MSQLISIIIPTHNFGFIIHETLNSLIAQTYSDWEAIILDDGSNDNTEEVVSQYIKKDHRFRYLKQENRGVSAARNKALSLAKGEWIQFLDADDLISPEKLEQQLLFLNRNPDVDICYSNHGYFETDKPGIIHPDFEMNNHNWLKKLCAQGKVMVNSLLTGNIAVISSPLTRKSVIMAVGGFPEQSKHTEDWEFWLKCALNGAFFCHLEHPNAQTLIRIHSRNTSRNIQVMQEGELKFRTRIIGYITESEFDEKSKEEWLELNQQRRMKLFKYMMYHTAMTDFSRLQSLRRLIKGKTFVSYYFKAINFQRKELFKKWGLR